MKKRFLTASLLLISSAYAMAEPATLLRDSELRASPNSNAAITQTLKKKDVIDIKSRKGAWAQINTAAGKTGWVRLLNLRTGSDQKGEGSLGTLASVFKTGSSGNTVSTGVKGLSEEKLKIAEPNDAEAAKLNKQKVSENDARSFAKQGKLSTQTINYLPEGKE